jgi:hypothetical protein
MRVKKGNPTTFEKVRLDAITAVLLKIQVFWEAMLCHYWASTSRHFDRITVPSSAGCQQHAWTAGILQMKALWSRQVVGTTHPTQHHILEDPLFNFWEKYQLTNVAHHNPYISTVSHLYKNVSESVIISLLLLLMPHLFMSSIFLYSSAFEVHFVTIQQLSDMNQDEDVFSWMWRHHIVQ